MAKGKLSQLHDLIHGNLPSSHTGTIIPRGKAIPLDRSLIGKARFARRIGRVFPILSPRNTMRLSEPMVQNQASVVVEDLLPDIPIGSLLSFRGRELIFVNDVADDELTITLTEGIKAPSYDVRTPVFLYGVPVDVDATASAGSTTLELSSDFIVVIGDVITELLTPDVPGSNVEHGVIDVEVVQEDTTPYQYVVTLDSPIRQELTAGSNVYLRAFPAFKSELIPLPTQTNVLGENIGPFLWDVQEGRLHDGIEQSELYLSVGTFSGGRLELDPISRVSKNQPHFSAPVPPSTFAFWDLDRGSLDFIGSYPVAVPDSLGDFILRKDLVPNFPEDLTWRATFQADSEVNLRIGWRVPNGTPNVPAGFTWVPELRMLYQDEVIPAGSIYPVVVQSPDLPSDRVEINFYSETADNRIFLREWAQDGPRSTWAVYSMTARVVGDYVWAAGGLLAKPIFFTEDDLKITQRFNSGTVMI